MPLRPILAAMRRNKYGALLIAVQMAVTLAFIANSFALIEHRLAWSARPTGVDEPNLFVIRSNSLGEHADAAARVQADLNALRALEGVVDAYVTNDYPFQGGGWAEGVNLTADQKTSNAESAHYFGDEHALNTLGVKLIAGRGFTADEVVLRKDGDAPSTHVYIVTKALADKLFPSGDALGKSIYVEDSSHPSQIIGILERLQGPYYAATGLVSTFADNSVMSPDRPVGDFPRYLVRVVPGRLDEVMKRAETLLLRADADRILRLQSMATLRADAYRGNHGLVVLLIAVCSALLVVTAFGIIGLTSYWVTSRRQQIGIRRALGATRLHIVQYFQTENLLIAAAGAAAGIALAIALNMWMVSSFEMVRLQDSRALGGALLLVLLGQLAVFWPARRAASIPPALATRGG
jgi:putative ABC transport system permease protein